jgi:hypothetical protein
MNILTFDIEDWFHILDNDSTKTAIEWPIVPNDWLLFSGIYLIPIRATKR